MCGGEYVEVKEIKECKKDNQVNHPNTNDKHKNYKLHKYKSSGINVMYTNADMLHNKLEEIETIANNENLDMIAVTETLLKNMPSDVKPEDFVFNIKGYNTVYNYKGRGLCLFV